MLLSLPFDILKYIVNNYLDHLSLTLLNIVIKGTKNKQLWSDTINKIYPDIFKSFTTYENDIEINDDNPIYIYKENQYIVFCVYFEHKWIAYVIVKNHNTFVKYILNNYCNGQHWHVLNDKYFCTYTIDNYKNNKISICIYSLETFQFIKLININSDSSFILSYINFMCLTENKLIVIIVDEWYEVDFYIS